MSKHGRVLLDKLGSRIEAGQSSKLSMFLGKLRSAWFVLTSDANVVLILNKKVINNREGQEKLVRSFGLGPKDMIRFMADILASSTMAVSAYNEKSMIENSINSPEVDQFLQNIKKGLQ